MEKKQTKKMKKWELYFYIIISIILVIEIFIIFRRQGWLPLWIDNLPSPLITQMEPAVREKRANFKIINAHEHIQSLDNIPLILKYMEDCQIEKMLLLGTSNYTFYLDLKYGFTGVDENNEEIIKISKEYPDKFIALCTIDPFDENKLEKLKKYIADGAKGLTLWNGHGFFHDHFLDLPLDDPGMMEIYQYCEDEEIPILYHINSSRPYFTQFEKILKTFPNLIIHAPHFVLTSRNLNFLVRLLDDYPNLYTDVSFGHPDFQVAGFERISNNSENFRKFVQKYRDRITFGTDMVITDHQSKSRTYLDNITLSYFDMLEKEEFTLPSELFKKMSKKSREKVDPNKVYKGLHLDDETLRMIYHDNAERIFWK